MAIVVDIVIKSEKNDKYCQNSWKSDNYTEGIQGKKPMTNIQNRKNKAKRFRATKFTTKG